MELLVQKTIDYRSTRALQICIVFICTLLLQRWLLFKHAGWIGFAVMMIYAGFDTGASLHRTFHRFWGAMFGLFLSFILWFFCRMDYRIILVIIPFIVFMAYFSLGKFYAYPTVFTVTLTTLGTAYYSNNNYDVANFFFDYIRATTIALCICLFFEYFVFKKTHLTHRFYQDLTQLMSQQLQQLFTIVITKPLRQSQFIKLSAQFNSKVMELHAFSQTAQHDYHLKNQQMNKIKSVSTQAEQIYQNIRQLFVGVPAHEDRLILDTKHLLDQLSLLIHHEQSLGE
jgi:uncharacterized membrane protein YccC